MSTTRPLQNAARSPRSATPAEAPRRGPLLAVLSHRLNRGERERVTRLFRERAAADRYVAHQEALGRCPVTVWQVEIPTWRRADPSW